jgi:hypothetical protein
VKKIENGEDIFPQHRNRMVIFPRNICYMFSCSFLNVTNLSLIKILTKSVCLPDVTEADLIKTINSINKKLSGVDAMPSSYKNVCFLHDRTPT